MTKFRIDVFSYLLVALAAGSLIWFQGDLFWLDSETKKTLAIIALCGSLVAIALYFGFEPRREEAAAARRLTKLLHWNSTQLTGTTQALLVPEDAPSRSDTLLRLCSHLRSQHGFRWRYRQPWLLLTGDDAAVAQLLPQLTEQGWLITADAVLLWNKSGQNGQPDTDWLKQLYKLRQRRPVDAVVLVTDGETELSTQRRVTHPHGIGLARIAEVLRWSRNAEDTVYRGVIHAFGENGGSKYPDQTLAALTAGTDTRGLFRSAAVVPGIFTRQAYEGYVAPAIEQAAKRTEIANDWVLTDGRPPQAQLAQQTAGRSAEALQAAFTEQYFADYAERWQGFMNSLQWEPAPTLPAAIDQLKLMADARQSPVIALMKSLEYQGGAGARKDSLSDTLVAKAQDLLGKKETAPEVAKPDAAGPLGAAFGPVLRLVAQGQAAGANPGANGDLSLQRFLDRATALRLRLQQVSNSADADAQARQMAQALFQGKGSELADTQAYAQLMAASLGSQWAGMGEALFVRPI
ncbi:hypothetical protein OR16_41506, partial [Cupriavidus basilensis OR16]